MIPDSWTTTDPVPAWVYQPELRAPATDDEPWTQGRDSRRRSGLLAAACLALALLLLAIRVGDPVSSNGFRPREVGWYAGEPRRHRTTSSGRPTVTDEMTQADRAVGAEAVLDAIRNEYTRARAKHAPLHSGHEAIGVIEEEWEEFRLAVFFGRDHRGDPANPAHEAIQIAAMALAYVVEAYPTWEFHRG